MSREQPDPPPKQVWQTVIVSVIATLLLAGLSWYFRPRGPQARIEPTKPPAEETDPPVSPTVTPIDPQSALQEQLHRSLNEARSLAYEDKRERACATFEEAIALMGDVESAQTRSNNIRQISFTVVQIATRLDRPTEILAGLLPIAEAMPDAETKARALSAIGGAFARLDDKTQARKILKRVPSLIAAVPFAREQKELAEGYIRMLGPLQVPDRELADELLDEIAQEATQFRHGEDVLRDIVQAYTYRSDDQPSTQSLVKALAVIQTFPSVRSRDGALSGLIGKISKLEDQQSAKEVLERTIATVEALPQTSSQVQMLHAIADVYVQMDDRDRGLALLERITPMAQNLGEREGQTTWLSRIATSYAGLGDTQRAAELLGYMMSNEAESTMSFNIRKLTLPYIVAATPENNANSKDLLDRLVPLAGDIANPLKQATALRTIAQSWIRLGEPTKAASALEQAIPPTLKLSDPSWQAGVLEQFAETAAELGDGDLAAPTLENILSLANQAPNEKLQSRMRDAVVDAYFKLERDNRAIAILETKPPSPKPQTSASPSIGIYPVATGHQQIEPILRSVLIRNPHIYPLIKAGVRLGHQ